MGSGCGRRRGPMSGGTSTRSPMMAAYALTCIWFLGNPFSPYYRLAALGQAADPFRHNALFFALYRDGRLYAYHFTRFPAEQIVAGEALPLAFSSATNRLTMSAGQLAHGTFG